MSGSGSQGEGGAAHPRGGLEAVRRNESGPDAATTADDGRGAYGSTAQKLIDLLERLVETPSGVALSDLARQQSIGKGTAHRLLAALMEAGLVEQPPGRDTYRLTLKLATLGFRHARRLGLLELCQPVLDRLADATEELVRMTLADPRGTRDQPRRLTWVARAQGARFGLRYDPDMGSPVVLHATASGRAWLATLPRDEALHAVEKAGFAVPDRFGAQTIRSLTALDEELDRTVERGFGLAVDEGEPGASAIAMAIPSDPHGRVGATVSIAGPTVRMSLDRIRQIAPLLRASAEELGELWPIIGTRVSEVS